MDLDPLVRSSNRSFSQRGSVVFAALTAAMAIAACGNDGKRSEISSSRSSAVTISPGATAAQIVSALQGQPGSPVQPGIAQGFSKIGAALQPQFTAGALTGEPKPATVLFPADASGGIHIEDAATTMAIDVSLPGAGSVPAQTAAGYVVYPGAAGKGTHVVHRALPSGSEDFLYISARPATPEVDFVVVLDPTVAGLRLVGGTLEFVDATGAPRLHVAPPYIVGADGTTTNGALAVAGCAVDTDASPPWGRPVTAVGAAACTVKVTWPDASVTYPAILDPRWTTTGSMATARFEHTLLLLSTGKALAAGGRSTTSGTTGLTTAELYDPASGTWAATGSMAGGRRLHSMTQLPTSSNSTTSGKVLVAGGISGSTSLTTAELYSVSSGTWTSAGALNAARHAHTATLLADGRVLVAGGLNGTATLQTAATYNPASGTGSWSATTGPIPPPGLKSHTATLIQTTNSQLNNKVLLVGGNNGTASLSSVVMYDPVQNAFSTLASIPSSPREQHTAVVLPSSNGKILVTGGKNGSTILNTAITFDPSSSNGTWSLAGTMTSPRVGHSMTVLPSSIVENGSVLVAGGSSTGSNTLSSAELFSGTTTWTATPSLPGPLQGQTAVVLSGNMVLVAGGLSSSTTVQSAAYLYDASFGLACSTSSQCASGFCANGVCCDTACNTGTCGACNLAGHLGTCTAKSSGTVCRAQSGGCDVAETCSGTSLVCPADSVAPLGSVCRSANGACDVPETCDGTTKACPADGFASATTVCRPSTNSCDAAETCTGTSATCPADAFAPAGTVCRPPAGGCDVAETCTGASAACPGDVVASVGTVCRAAQSLCDRAETCSGSSAACPGDAFAAAGTTCGAATSGTPAPVCSGSSGTCPVASGTSDVLGFEALGDWAFDPATGGSVVGLNSSRTQGASSFEVTAQGLSRLNSAAVSSIGAVGPIVLLDIQLPTNQANPSSYGDAQMFVNSPSLGINNVSLGDIQLTGLALGSWQTLAFQLPAATASTIAQGMYSDLTFSVVLNVPSNETGHYLLDNIRAVPDVVPSLLGVAQAGSTLKAVFDYLTTSSTPITIPYGTGNGLRNASGFIASPPESPPTTFVSFTHAPFVATLSGSSLTWTVGTRSVTATPGSSRLPVTTLGDGTHDATLPDGRKVNLDSVPPASPVLAAGPTVGDPFNGVLNGQLSVSPSGAATYSVPISVPPGIAGMAPNLSLAYNSQGPDGVAGQGWSLTGLSMITRCPRTMQQDGYGRPVMSDSLTPSDNPDGKSDGICLDGKKLFEKANAPGTYTGESQDFSTITRTGTQFQVVTKAGETRYYGRLSSSNIQQGMWLLDRVVDAWGNYFDIHYNNDQGNGGAPNGFTSSGIWVSKIDYTGTLTNSSCTGTNPPSSCTFASVTFQYECRGDIRWSRVGAIRLPQSQRLRTITTSRGIYSLAYSDATTHVDGQGCPVGAGPTTGVSELQSINYCAGSTCTKPLTFGWQPSPTGGWQPKSGYVLPTQYVRPGKGLKGTQFVDINGDGRVDFVLGRANGVAGEGQPELLTLLNTGSGWGPPLIGSGQIFPLYLSDLDDKATPVRFADLDGDGRLDVMVDKANVTCSSPGVCVSCPINQPCPGAQAFGPAVWLNRFSLDGTGSWLFASDYSGTSMTFNDATQFADLDNDNRADIINLIETGSNPTTLSVQVIFNKVVQGAHVWTVRTETYPNLPLLNGAMRAQDVNRDGYPDLVQDQFFQYPDGSVAATELDLINKGPAQTAGQLTFNPIVHNAPGGGSIINSSRYLPHQGDIDGDGFHDVVQFGGIGRPGGRNYFASVSMGDGTGFGFTGGAGPYLGVLQAFAPPVCNDFFSGCALDDLSEDYGFAIADINGDGLADLVRNHSNRINGGIEGNQGGGEILLNTGQKWVSIAGHTDWHVGAGVGRVPGVVPSEMELNPVSTFLDFDGDGMLDFLQEEGSTFGLPAGAWASPYGRRVIKTFPNGLAHSTVVTYVSITSAAGASVYKDDDATGANTKPFVLPLMVVSSVDREDASGTTSRATQTYTYHSLRTDEFGRGPLGFHRVEVLDQASQVRTTTTYAQAYPFTGLPIEVDKYQVVGGQAHLRTKTTTSYCSTPLGCNPLAAGPVAPGTIVFTSPSTVTDIAYLHPESDDLVNRTTTVTSFLFDALGNGTDTITRTTKVEGTRSETFQTEVQNFYEIVQAANEGKPTRTVTTATGGTGSKTHTTAFEYAGANTFGGVSARLALTKKLVEPGAGWPLELDTAYRYDQFGNLRTTTSCASDFTSCVAGATNPASSGAINPADPSDPVHHPPFRTTTVSYNPADLSVPVPYNLGRFPTKTTNALGQSETSVYETAFGKVLSKTGPNGIQTCYAYDALGRQTSQTERCNSATPLVTTTQYFLTAQFCILENCTPTAFAPPNSKTVVITTPPTGAIAWSYSDDQGKSTGSLAYAFDGGFIETTTAYNARGQVTQVTRPFHLTSVDDPGSPSYTTTTYDSFNRVDTVTDPLGVIDDSGVAKATIIQTLYNGSTLETIRLVNGQTQNRFETKNAIGKVASVTTGTESGPSTISYDYDADGNLTFTTDPALNQVQIGYDARGRKASTTDPDLGNWTYTVDGFGDVVTQRDAKAQTTTMIYDGLGRLRSKTDSTGTAEWLFDSAPGAGIGKLAAMIGAPDTKLLATCAIPSGASVTGGQRAVKSFRYTPFGDAQEVDECADGTTFATTFQYDAVGRQSLIRYPAVNTSQLAVGYHYTTAGYLHYLTDESSDYSVLWRAKAMNALGQVTDEQMRNGVETVSNRNPLTGWLLGATATAHADGDKLIQNWSYGFDEIGNLLTRKRADAVNAVTSSETFTYDLTNRLVSSLVTTSGGYNSSESYVYDGLGNLTQKAGKTYTYGGCAAGARTAGPHAVCTVAGGTPFVYDDNGNVTRSGSRSVTYNPSNKVTNVVSDPVPSQGHDTGSVDFMYGADGNRVVQSVTSGGATSRTVYVGLGATGKSIYERTTTGSTVQHVTFIYAGEIHGGNAFALRIFDNSGAVTGNRFYSLDHLGSVTAMSDDVGHVAAPQNPGPNDTTLLGYDAWGARRKPDGTAAPSASFDLSVGHRQFTGQEQIPEVGLVNMNGRVYDPSLGRFLSPDPNVQAASDLQSYNRYSYALNNPLRYTDPTGYSSSDNGPDWWWYGFQTVMVAAVCVVSEGYGCVVAGLMYAAMDAFVAIELGAPWDQTLLNTGIGLGIGFVVGGGVGAAGGGALASIIAGSASAAVTTGIANVMAGRDFFEWNMLTAAVISAAEASVIIGLQKAGPVSQAAAEEAQGGGGAGEDRLEKGIRRPAFLNDKNDVDHDPFVVDQRQNIVDQRVKKYGFYFMEGKTPTYDPDLPIEGETSPGGSVRIGPKAFSSNGWLDSSLLHESVHVEQIRDGTWTSTSTNMNEVQAYDRELGMARKFALTPAEVGQLQVLRQPYYDQLGFFERWGVRFGIY